MSNSKKTLEEYQIQDIAKGVLAEMSSEFIRRGEYDRYTLGNDNEVKSLSKRVGTLETKDIERDKDKKAYKIQIAGIIFGFIFQFVIWAIIASNGFKVGQ